MKIGFDLDGVLVDFSAMAAEAIRETYRPDLPKNYVQQEWNFEDIITPQQWDSVFHKMLKVDNLWTHAPAMENNVEALRHYIAQRGEDDIYFLTARPRCEGGSQRTMTQLWLLDHGLPFKNLHFVTDAGEKKDYIQLVLGLDFFLDDLPKTVEALQRVDGLHPYLLDWPYNRDADLPRVHSVDEYLLEIAIAS